MSIAEDVDGLADQAAQALGGVDILVNNAAIYPQHTWLAGAAAEWSRLYEVNVVAAVRLIQRLVPAPAAA
jgi:NAD(P)-dependent dehydrogenase (short-subunit alcohol dehydrogenase family)